MREYALRHRLDTFFARPEGKNDSNASIFNGYLSGFFIEFLISFLESEPLGTIFAELEVLWTVRFF